MNRNAFRVPTSQPGSRMPQYNQQQLPATPGADVSARLSDSAGQIIAQGADQQAKGLDMLGRGMQQAAKAGYDFYNDYQSTKAKEAWLTYKQEATVKRAEFGKMQGKDAIDPDKGIEAQMAAWRTERRQTLMKDLGGPAASMFDTAAKDIDSSMDAWAIDKVNTERLNYENKTSEAHISLLQDEAMTLAANPALFGEKMGALEGELKAIAGRSGLDETWVKAKFQDVQQKTLTQTISDSIAGEQLGKANAMIKAYGPMLGGAAEGLRARADAKGRELQARAREEKERNDRKFSADFGNQLFSTFRLDAAGAQRQIEEKVKDPVLQERVFQSYLTRSAIEEHMQSKIATQAQAADYNNAINKAQAVLRDGEITDKAAALSEVVTSVSDQETRERVRSFVDDALNGAESPYSKTALAEAQEYAAQPGVTADMVTSKYKGQLPYSALQKATKTAESEQSKRSEQLMHDEITQMLTDKYGFTQHQATAGYRTILSKITGITEPEQRLKMAREFTREISIKDEKSLNWRIGWFGGAKVPAYDFTHEKEASADLKVRSVPDDALPVVDAGLKAENILITKESRLEYYTKMLTKRVR